METMMTNDQRFGEKEKQLARKLFELQCELEKYQSMNGSYEERREIRSTILAIDILLMKLIEFDRG